MYFLRKSLFLWYIPLNHKLSMNVQNTLLTYNRNIFLKLVKYCHDFILYDLLAVDLQFNVDLHLLCKATKSQVIIIL